MLDSLQMEGVMRLPELDEKVAFLAKPEAYPECAGDVEAVQTHMSWVFLTDTHAWKLKKPVRTEFLDLSTPDKRRLNCRNEVRLNRRLAPDVYHSVVPLTVNSQGKLQLGGAGGQQVDWLVCMRRLPSDRMLDRLIARHAVTAEDVSQLAWRLASFYRLAARIPITGLQYRRQLAKHLEAVRAELTRTKYGLSPDSVQSKVGLELEFLEQNRALFDARAEAGKIVDAHGDLRPEHICLEPEPVVIDCLEFNRSLRILDVASELMFLTLECERLGGRGIGDLVLKAYSDDTGDRPPEPLLHFYRGYHACIRAKIAAWHIKDHISNPAFWTEEANRYLKLVRPLDVAA